MTKHPLSNDETATPQDMDGRNLASSNTGGPHMTPLVSWSTHLPIDHTVLLTMQPNAILVDPRGLAVGVGSALPEHLQTATGKRLSEVFVQIPGAHGIYDLWQAKGVQGGSFKGRWVDLPQGWRTLVLHQESASEQAPDEAPCRGLELWGSLRTAAVITDRSGRVQRVNRRFVDLFGFNPKDFIGRHAGDLLTAPATDLDVLKKLGVAMRSGEPFVEEIEYATNASATRWVEVQGEPIRDEHGLFAGHLIQYVDIDERKRTSALQLSERTVYETLLRNTGDGIYIHDLHTGEESWVAGLRRLYGVSDEVPQPPMRDWLERLPHSVAVEVKRIAEAYRAGEVTSHVLELPLQGYDGVTRWLLDRGQVLERGADGLPRSVLGVVSDIDDWKQKQAKAEREAELYHASLQGTGDGVWEMDLRTMEAQWGPGLERLLGLPKGAPGPRPQDWLARVPVTTAQQLSDLGEQYRKGLINDHSLEYPIEGFDGRVRWVMDRGRVLERDQQGLPIRLVGLVTDVSGFKQTQEELDRSEQRMNALLGNLNQALLFEDEDNIVRLVNPEFCASVGKHARDLIGKRTCDLSQGLELPQALDPERFHEGIRQRLTEQTAVKGERIPLQDGRVLERDYTPVLLNGRCIGHLWVFRDITDRERLEQEVQGTKELLDLVVAALGTGIVVDVDGHIHLANKALCTLFGAERAPETLIGMDGQKAVADFASLMREPEAFLARVGELKRDRRPVKGDLLHLKDGRSIERDFVPVDLANGSRVNVFSYRDVSDHHQLLRALQFSSDQLSLVIESMGAGLLMEDPQGRLLLTNAALMEQFAITEAERSAEQGSDHALHAALASGMADPTSYLDAVRSDIHRGMAVAARSFQLKSGRVLECSHHPMPFASGNGHLWTYTDITDRHRLEREKQDEVQARERLLKALADATGRLVLTNDVMAELPAIFEQIGTATAVHRVYMFENTLDPAGDTIASSQRMEWNSGVAEPQINNPDLQNVPVELFEEFVSPMLIGEHFARAVRDVEHDLFRTTLEAQGIIAILILPITVRGRLWGFIGFDDRLKERQWTANELAVLRSLSAAIAAAVERHLLTQERDMELRAERTVNSLTRRIMGLQQEAEVYQAVVGEISHFLDLEHCSFHVTRWKNGMYHQIAVHTTPASVSDHRVPEGVIRLRDMALQDLDPYRAKPIRLWDQGTNGRATHAIIPVTTGSELLGFIGASCNAKACEEDLLMRVLERAADAVAVKLMQIRAFQLVRQQDERYHHIINNMQLGLVEVDREQRIVAVNQKFVELSGHPRSALLGQSLLMFPGVEHAATLFAEKRELRRNGMSDAYELDVRNASGQMRHWFISGAPSADPHGDHSGSVNVILDITDRKRMEQDLFDANIKARSSLQAKELFLANMSHEMRTPMNVVLGLSDALIRQEQRPEQLDQLLTMRQATRNLLALTNDILELSRATSGNLELHPRPYSLRALIGHIEKLFQPQASSQGLRLTTSIDPGLEALHMVDAQRLDQVLVNLVGNAIKFTMNGQVAITLKAGPVIEGSQRLVITVSDTGLGMSPAYMERLFEPFSRDPMLHGSEIEGSGLGLSICKHLMDLMHGSIKVESGPGKGTMVDVGLELPLAAAEHTFPIATKEAAEVTLRASKVLLAEDSAFNRKVVAAMLKGQPIDLLEVEHGAAALEMMTKHRFDLVLLDLRMPVMDGHEFLRLLRDVLHDPVPVLALTAADMEQGRSLVEDNRGSRLLQKPFERSDLLQHMAELLAPSIVQSTHGTPPRRWDRSSLSSLVDNDPDIVHDIIQVFQQEAPRTLDELGKAARMNNVARMGELAHRMRPSLRMLGITDALSMVDELIASGRSAAMTGRERGLVAVIRQIVEDVLKDLCDQ